MTVAELIALLKELPPECEVMVADWNEQYVAETPLTCMLVNSDRNEVILQDE